MATSDWLPARLADKATMFENILVKLGSYTSTLGLFPAQYNKIIAICQEFDCAYTYTEQSRATVSSIVQWRDIVLRGSPQGSPAPDPPLIPPSSWMSTYTVGCINEFRDFRDIILAAPGYTDAIGEDLMIVGGGGGTGPSVPVGEATPELKTQVGSGYEVNIAGPMHGMDAMRVEYQRNNDGNAWNLVGFLTKTPGVVIISPHTPGEPESGRIRARYIKNNVPVGNYSQEAAVTVSA